VINGWKKSGSKWDFQNNSMINHRIKNKDKFKELIFVGQSMNYDSSLISAQEVKKKSLILERIIKICNKANTTKLPEILDYIEYNDNTKIYENSGIKDKMIIMEFLKGITIEKSIEEGLFKNKNNNQINLFRLFRKIFKNIVDFETRMYKKDLFHIGLFPDHIIIQKDDIIKFKGLRYMVQHKEGKINDPSIFNNLYGNIERKRYSSPSLRKKLRGEYDTVYVLDVMSHQIGVLLYDILTQGKYMHEDKFFMPTESVLNEINIQKKSHEYLVKKLVFDLTNPDISKRTYRPDEILDRFDEIITV
jgi:hypothetical protein